MRMRTRLLVFLIRRVPFFHSALQWTLGEGMHLLWIPFTGLERYRFSTGTPRARRALRRGRLDTAVRIAEETLTAAPRFMREWDYGNAVHHAHLVLGHVALARGSTDDAVKHLLEAGKTPGSPQLNSFGPNMGLARDLLVAGRKDDVLQYFDLCRASWNDRYARLDEWTETVRAGDAPEFGANLNY